MAVAIPLLSVFPPTDVFVADSYRAGGDALGAARRKQKTFPALPKTAFPVTQTLEVPASP
jgi:hypothetical protein